MKLLTNSQKAPYCFPTFVERRDRVHFPRRPQEETEPFTAVHQFKMASKINHKTSCLDGATIDKSVYKQISDDEPDVQCLNESPSCFLLVDCTQAHFRMCCKTKHEDTDNRGLLEEHLHQLYNRISDIDWLKLTLLI